MRSFVNLVFITSLVSSIDNFAHAEGEFHGTVKSTEATAPRKDVVMVDKEGGRTLFFCEGDNVVVQKCEKIKGAIKKREDCKNALGGPPNTNTVPRKFFEASLLAKIKISNLPKLKGLSKEEVDRFENQGATVRYQRQVYEELKQEIAELHEYLEEVGPRNEKKWKEYNVLQEKTRSLEVFLKNASDVEGAIEAVNKQLEPLMKNICDPSFIKKVEAGFGEEQSVIATFLEDYSPNFFPCGSSGPKQARAIDCGYSVKSDNGTRTLIKVEKDKNGKFGYWWEIDAEANRKFVLSPLFPEMKDKEAKDFCEKLEGPGSKLRCRLLSFGDIWGALQKEKVNEWGIFNDFKKYNGPRVGSSKIDDLLYEGHFWVGQPDGGVGAVGNDRRVTLDPTQNKFLGPDMMRSFHCACEGAE